MSTSTADRHGGTAAIDALDCPLASASSVGRDRPARARRRSAR
ncbi:hypothetical protein [Sorangium sp. So ce1099]